MPGPPSFRNDFLKALAPGDLSALLPHLESVDLPLRRQLARANRLIEHAYFLESGVASNTANLRHEMPVEIGLTGRDGVCNLAALLGADRTPADVYMQIPGAGHRIEVEQIRRVMAERPGVARLAMLMAYLALVQIGGTALANSRGDLAERLARWLLMAHDRVEGDKMALTHEFMAVMLGVRRSGVTTALNDLERTGLVSRSRGLVQILDRAGLAEMAGGFYGGPEAEARRLLGASG